MKTIKKISTVLLLIVGVLGYTQTQKPEIKTPENLQTNKLGKISGLMFGDYYEVFNQNHTEIENFNGFWFRRIYFTYENNLNSTLSVRLRLELASSGDFNTTSQAILPLVKDAYLKWKFNPNHELLLGISESPTWRTVEKTWGHRFLEKTPLDLQKWGSSRDFGIGVRGNITTNGKLKYYLMVGNGSGNKTETNKGKKVLSAITWFPTKEFIFEIYGDWNDNTGHTDWITGQVFGAYKGPNLTLGLQYAIQDRQGETQDQTYELFSAFATYKLHEKWGLVGRVDRNFDANPKGESISYIPFNDTASSLFYVFGIDYKPWKNVTFTPNVELVSYNKNDEGVTPDTDVYGRLTFYWKF
jgi:hypothetical protein